ncbi:MAG: M56 family metallopeptidase [Gemmatimonadota bacterium]
MFTEFSLTDTIALLPLALVVLKATLVLLVALMLTALMRRASASSRHLVWVASLLALLALPVLAVWTPVRFAVLPASWGAGVPVATPVVSDVRASNDVASGIIDAPAVASNPSPLAQETTRRDVARVVTPVPTASRLSPLAIVTAVWALGAVGLLGWLAYGALAVRRLVRGAVPLTDVAWQHTLLEIADRLALDAVPQLVRSEAVTMPFAAGLRRPVIVLPHDCDVWAPDRRAAVLLHELAHIRRRDIVAHTLGRVSSALYWFHPLAWTAARRQRAESERACDDLALACGTRASDYAEHLLDIVTSVRNHATPSMAMAMATRSEFEGRMLAILDPEQSRHAPTRVQASTLAGGVMMFAIVAGSSVPRVATPELPDTRPLSVTATGNAPRDPASQQQLVATDTTRRAKPAPPVALDSMRRTPEREATLDELDAGEEAELDTLDALRGRTQRELQWNATRLGRTADTSARATLLARILATDTSATLRRTAAWGLEDHAQHPAARAALLDAVRQDRSADVREMAAWALSNAAGDERVAAALADAYAAERERSVRATLLWAIGDGASSRSREAVATLTAALNDTDPKVRQSAIWGLGNVGPRRAPAALIDALRDPDAQVRSLTAWALYEIEDSTAAPALLQALEREKEGDTRWAMVRALGVMGEAAVAPMQRLIEGNDAALRALAIRALAGASGQPWPQPRPRPRPYP